MALRLSLRRTKYALAVLRRARLRLSRGFGRFSDDSLGTHWEFVGCGNSTVTERSPPGNAWASMPARCAVAMAEQWKVRARVRLVWPDRDRAVGMAGRVGSTLPARCVVRRW